MANEINIQAVLTGQRFSPPMQGSGNLNINQTNTHCIGNVQNVPTAGLALQFGDCSTNLGYLFVKNLDATNYVQLTLDSGFAQIFAKLRPSEFCLMPVNQNTIYAKANTAACDVMVCAAQT